MPDALLAAGPEIAARAAVLLALGALGAHLLRAVSAETRRRLWGAAILSALTLPVASLALPSIPLRILPPEPAAPAAHALHAPSAHTHTPTPAPSAERFALSAATTTTTAAHAAPSRAGAARSLPSLDLPAALALVWAAGAISLLARLGASLLAVRRIERSAEVIDDPEWLQCLALARRRAGLRGPVRLLRSGAIDSPMTWGGVLGRPVVAMPEASARWTPDRRRLALLHECIHAGRRDWLLQTCATALCAVHWFNPLAWLAASRLAVERERACDERAIDAGAPRAAYAQLLLDVARSFSAGARSAPSATLAMARTSELEGRLLMILSNPAASRRGGALVAPLALLSAAGLIALAQPQRADPEDHRHDHDRSAHAQAHEAHGEAHAAHEAVTLGRSTSWKGSSSSSSSTPDGLRTSVSVMGGASIEFGESSTTLELGDHGVILLESEFEDRSALLRMSGRPGGEVDRLFTVDGRERPFDDRAKEWFVAMLEIARGNAETGRINGQVGALHGKIGAIHGEIGARNGRIGQLNGQAGALRGKIGAIHGDIGRLNGELGRLNGEHARLRGELLRLQSQTKGPAQRIRAADEAIRRLEKRADELERSGQTDAADRIRTELRALKLERDSASAEVEALQRDTDLRIEQTMRDIERTEADREAMRARIAQARADAEREAKVIHEKIAALEQEAEAQRRENDGESSDARARIARIEGEIEALDAKGRIEKIQREVIEPARERLKKAMQGL